MLHAARNNEWNLVIESPVDGTRPTSPNWGTAVTPAQNAYGSYAQVVAGASVTDDAYEIEICITDVAVATLSRECLVTIGIDPAGGTSYTDLIQHLVGSMAGGYNMGANGGGYEYKFPLKIPAGASIAAKASVSTADLTAIAVALKLYCRPSCPELFHPGRFVRTFGADTANSRGTIFTPGTTGEGAWTQIGSALAEPLWFWEFGLSVTDSTMSANAMHVDVGLGDASNKKIAIPNERIGTTNAESLAKGIAGHYRQAAVGDLVYLRAQASGTLDTDYNAIVYGVGG